MAVITSTRSRTRFVWLLALAGCKGQDAAPELFPLADAQTAVGAELLIVLGATDPDGDPLTYAFRSDESVTAGATLEPDGAGARFTWTPTIDDLGPHEVTFTVQDGWLLDSATVEVLVVASEGSTAPVFVQPLGTGTTLDLGRGPCVEVPIVVTDPDTPGVTLGEAEPRIDGGELVQLDELTGTWTFCPTREQIGSGDRYALQLTAEDFENPPTVKPYTIVVLGENGSSCPGDPPTVEHAPTDVRSLADVPITVRIRDDQGLKFEPLLYASSTDPGEPPDLTAMTQLTMSLASGTTQDGTWTALVPNPAARLSTGADAPLWYVVAATDNDDLEGSCDHTVLAPEGGSWSITVENPGGQGDGGICDPCTADAQCGGAGDLCVFFGDGPHCFADCELDTDCPADHYCSFSTFTSVDGERGRQCLPNDLVCDPPEPECLDDALEDNDTRATAVPLSEGLHHLTSCPASTGDDEDWYEVHLTGESTIEAILDGGPATDLDLALYDPSGLLVDRSDGLSSLEAVSACVPAGDYTLRVYAWGQGENDYDLDLDVIRGACAPQCTDDTNEPDDGPSTARWVDLDLGRYRTFDQQICSGDDDWYDLYLFAGETFWATLTFTQSNPTQDLDLVLVDELGYVLLGCTEDFPLLCDPTNGQSATSNEAMAAMVTVSDDYYLVVRGWDGSENDYDLCVGLSRSDCP